VLSRLLLTLRRHAGAAAACLWAESNGGLCLIAADPADLPLGETVPHPGGAITEAMERGALNLVFMDQPDSGLPALPLLQDRLASRVVAVLPVRSTDSRSPAAICLYLPEPPDDAAARLFEWGRWAQVAGAALDAGTIRLLPPDSGEYPLADLRPENIHVVAAGLARRVGIQLATVLTSLQHASGMLESDDPATRFLDHATEGIDRTRELLARLQQFAGQDPLFAESVSVADCAAEAVRRLETERPNQVRLTLSIPPGLPAALADRIQITAAIEEVIRNALEASPAGTDVSAGIMLEDETIRVEVIDQGVGMAPEVLEKAALPFFTTKHLAKHAGIGLSTTDGIVRRHGGKVSVSSRPGGGTTVRMWIPLRVQSPTIPQG
jgi:signal transduction histidine kinase